MSLPALWHPAGPGAARIEVLQAPSGSAAPLDVAVVAPAGGGGDARLRATVAEAAARLDGDGIAWVVVGRRERRIAERALRRAGLVVVDRVLMVPGWPATAHLVALAPAAVRDAGVRHLGLSPRRARAMALLCCGRIGRLALARAAPGCGVVAARPGGTAPLRWLAAIDGSDGATATLSTGRRRDARVAVALRFARGAPAPDLVVKVALDAAGALRVDAERDALQRLGPAAARAGAAIPAPRPPRTAQRDAPQLGPSPARPGAAVPAPQPPLTALRGAGAGAGVPAPRNPRMAERDVLQLGAAAGGAGPAPGTGRAAAGPAMLVTGALPGSPASGLLRRAPDRLGAVLHAVADWLLAWNRATAGSSRATAALLERRLLGPAERIAAAVPATARHAASMRALAERLDGAPLVTVAAHRDLTMSNVLVGSTGLGVVDWEAAGADDLPLLDLWYALADGVARARGVDHRHAVASLRAAATTLPAGLAALPARHAAALGLSADQARLGFHACWLGHADDELSRGTPGPFLAVVEAIAAQDRDRP